MTPGRIVFVNRFYWPEEPATAQLLTDLAEAMALEKRAVIVITSRPRRSPQPSHDHRNGVEICRVSGTKLGNRNILFHACDFLTFALMALLRVAITARRGDTLVILTDPPLFGIPATLIGRLRGARVIHWIQDIYPEAAVLLTGKKAFGWLRGPRDTAWRAADACVTLGEDMAALPKAARVKPERLHLVPNWAPAGVTVVSAHEAERLRNDWGLTGKFVVAYFGNLGRVHDLGPVLDVAAKLLDEPSFQFVFIGPGAQRAGLEADATRRNLHNVRFFPAQPRERRTEILALGDVHLVTLHEGGERVVFPSKLYGICAAGKPVLFIGPPQSEIAGEIRRRSLGIAHSRREISQIAESLRTLRSSPSQIATLSAASRAYYESEASVEQAKARWQRVFTAVELAARS